MSVSSLRVVLATRNPHKLEEMQRILVEAGLDIDLVTADNSAPDVAETEPTFAGNAMLKARALAVHTGLPAIADDSGLCVDALNGMPGVLSARWCGRHGDDQANLELVLGQLSDVPDFRRSAQFVCAAALVVPAGTLDGQPIERVVEGTVEGALTREPRGTNGFGYDPIFVPRGERRTTAEMDPDEKDAISHRGQAMRALVPVLRDITTPQDD